MKIWQDHLPISKTGGKTLSKFENKKICKPSASTRKKKIKALALLEKTRVKILSGSKITLSKQAVLSNNLSTAEKP